MTRLINSILIVAALAGLAATDVAAKEKPADLTVIVLVMDPLCEALACDCVEGYAQRDYLALGKFLETQIKRPVKIVFGESIKKAFKGNENAKVDLIIGKDSVVRYDLKKSKQQADLLLQLTDKTGKTTQTGLFVVPAADPALSVLDLTDYRIFFGPADSAEKHQAPMKLLTDLNVAKPAKTETCPACSDGAAKILEFGPSVRACAVISSQLRTTVA
jgi:ABC-type phosphate/phosphonate transport system substrate-binding protein